METEDRWYVRFRGHTLGPLTSEQVKASVRGKELGPDDKLASTSNPVWRPLRTQAEFLRCWESLQRPLPVELTPLPSPKILWQKKRAPLPKAPDKSLTAKAPESPAPKAVPQTVETQKAPVKAATQDARAKKAAPKSPTKAKKNLRGSGSRSGSAKKKTVAKAVASKAAEPVVPAQVEAERQAPAQTLPEMQTSAPAPTANPVSPSILAAIPEKPSFPPEPAPASAHPKLAEETLSLLEALRDWNRQEQSRLEETRAADSAKATEPNLSPPVMSPAPSATEPPAALAAQTAQVSAPDLPVESADKPKGIELKLSLTISKQFIFVFAAVSALALAALVFSLGQTQKMRGPADSRLPDPSSPTTNPSTEYDPIPQLKAPTRPKRD